MRLTLSQEMTYPARNQRAQNSGLEGRLLTLILVLLILFVVARRVLTRSLVVNLDDSATLLVCDIVTQSDVRDLDVGRGNERSRFPRLDGETPARESTDASETP